MSATIEYVYCVVPAVTPADVPATGLAGADEAPRGIDGTAVRRIVTGQLAALVSTLDSADYAADAVAERAGDPEWLTPRAVSHDVVVTWASDRGPVVPLPMWVMFAGTSGIASMLATRASLLQRGLESVAGAREYAVRIAGDRQALAAAATSLDPALAALEQQAAGATPGQAYLLRRKLAAARKDVARDVATRVATDVHRALAAAARTSVLRSGATTGDHPSLMLDAAYLVPDDNYDHFRLVLTQLIERYGTSGCRFDFTGPWPPYHFVRGDE